MLAAAKDNIFSDQSAVKNVPYYDFFLFWDIHTEDRRYFRPFFFIIGTEWTIRLINIISGNRQYKRNL